MGFLKNLIGSDGSDDDGDAPAETDEGEEIPPELMRQKHGEARPVWHESDQAKMTPSEQRAKERALKDLNQ